ncbi:MAG: glycosyltransferase family 9 protein, partial [Planctomycetes bacterium]|nr:glycosyltransferase family 9 protein [Planctomycetota bacterium]
ERQLAGVYGLRVAIHPGARWMTKRWPVGHYTEIARRLERESGAQIVLVGGPEEGDVAREIEATIRNRCLNLTGLTTLKQLAAVLSRVNLLLTNDSGPMHLAAALGTPVAGIFTCTSPERARPYGSGHLIIGTSVWCAASYLKKCSRMECMSELTPDRVWPLVRDHLAALSPPAVASA